MSLKKITVFSLFIVGLILILVIDYDRCPFKLLLLVVVIGFTMLVSSVILWRKWKIPTE